MANKKKIGKIIMNVLTVLIILFAVLVVLFTVFSTLTVGKQNRILFGHRAYIVQSDSMKDTFEAGDIIVVRVQEDVSDLSPGTIITFISSNTDSYGETVTHMIKEKIEVDGHVAYTTYGTTTGAEDEKPVLTENILGVYSFRLPKMGYFFQFMKTPLGYVVVILVPFLLLIGANAARFVGLLRAYGKEKKQAQAQAAEQADADRAEAQRLKEELEQLKAKLSEQDQQDIENKEG